MNGSQCTELTSAHSRDTPKKGVKFKRNPTPQSCTGWNPKGLTNAPLAAGAPYPRTGTLAALAAVITSPNLSRLSSMEQLMFFLVKSSDAAPKIDTSLAPAATCHEEA